MIIKLCFAYWVIALLTLQSHSAEFKQHADGALWQIELTHAEIQQIAKDPNSVSSLLTDKAAAAIVSTQIALIKTMDMLGRNSGVTILASPKVGGYMIMPHGTAGNVEDLAIGLAKAVKENPDIKYWVVNPFFAANYSVLEWIFGKKEKPKEISYGLLVCNRKQPGEWERFCISSLGDGTVAMLGRQGYLSEDQGNAVANRTKIADWERWTIVVNEDQTVSFKSYRGKFLCADQGGGTEKVTADRDKAADWEKFTLEFKDGYTFIKTKTGFYITVSSAASSNQATNISTQTANVSKCTFCGSAGYGNCRSSPSGRHEHNTDQKHCQFCGSAGYGPSCNYSPDKHHRHGSGGNKCKFCGSEGLGNSCANGPGGKHVR